MAIIDLAVGRVAVHCIMHSNSSFKKTQRKKSKCYTTGCLLIFAVLTVTQGTITEMSGGVRSIGISERAHQLI